MLFSEQAVQSRVIPKRVVLTAERLDDRTAPSVVTATRTFNDPSAAQQTGLVQVAAPTAWDAAVGTRNTIVAVIDSGIDTRHPDLAANLWVNPREVPGNRRDDDGNGFVDDVNGYDFANNDPDPSDDNRHGTHVAGILGAVGNNGTGGTGVNPNTRIMALKFMAADGSGFTSDAARALDYAVANGAKVVNASWGTEARNSQLAAAIGRARDRGVIIVAAAGNDGRNTDAVGFFPASFDRDNDNVIGVAAVDAQDRLAAFSNFGPGTVTLAAPGVNILSTLPNDRTGSLSGTSMATPFVSGALALLWDQNPTWTYRQVVDRLKQSVDRVPGLTGRVETGGRLNVAKLLGVSAAPVVPPTVPPTPTPTPTPIPTPTPTPTPTPAVTDRFTVTVNGPVTVPDQSSVSIPIVVTQPGQLADLKVRLNISHQRVGDLVVQLRAPNGLKITLANRRGGNGSGFANTVFDDSARTTIGSAPSPFAATFRPDGSLSTFRGTAVAGTWTLIVADAATGRTGRVNSIQLDFGRASTVTQAELAEMGFDARPDAVAAVFTVPAVSRGSGELRPETRRLLGDSTRHSVDTAEPVAVVRQASSTPAVERFMAWGDAPDARD